MGLNMTSCKKNMKQDDISDIQMKPGDVLIFKGDKQVSNQQNYLDNCFLLYQQKKYVEVFNDFLRRDKKKMK